MLLLLARIAQGLSLGGEVSNASAYLGEIAPPERRGRYSAFFYISTGSAVLLASILGYVLSHTMSTPMLTSYGWRIPFWWAACSGWSGWCCAARSRRRNRSRRTRTRVEGPAAHDADGNTRRRWAGWWATTAVDPLLLHVLQRADAVRGDEPARGGTGRFLALSIGTALFVALQYPLGALADRFGRKPQMLVFTAATAVLSVPLSTLIGPGLAGLTVVFCVGLGLYTAQTSIAPALMSELFPTEVRALGIGAWYNITVALLGGTAPLVITRWPRPGCPRCSSGTSRRSR